MLLTIAIDGPVGAGKSTIARGLAERLNILYLDTGAMYRALALKAVREGVDAEDGVAVAALVKGADVSVRLDGGGQRTMLDGDDVTALLRTPEVTAMASALAKNAAVRAAMVALQQACAARDSMVLDGRDIGTRVLPNATYKFYLDADVEVRARRRYEENLQKGIDLPYETVLRDAIARDEQDMNREVDPLRVAEDAMVVNTTAMNVDEVVAHLLGIVGETRT